MTYCAFCGEGLDVIAKVSRRDICPHCHRDLRCCRQCKSYDPSAFNECREVSAERILDKERANLCDYFLFRGSRGMGGTPYRTQEARKALEALFGNKQG